MSTWEQNRNVGMPERVTEFTLASEQNARLHSRCRELGIIGHSRMNRAAMKQAILAKIDPVSSCTKPIQTQGDTFP